MERKPLRQYGSSSSRTTCRQPVKLTLPHGTLLHRHILQEVRPPVLHLALFPTGITAYTLGDTGGAVFVIQGILQAIQNNFPKIPPISNSGVFDTATQNAVKQFQSYTPLPADGVVDAATWNHLLAALDAEIRNSAGVV